MLAAIERHPVIHLAAAIAKIGNYSAPVHFTSIVRRYFEGLAPLEDERNWKVDPLDETQTAANMRFA